MWSLVSESSLVTPVIHTCRQEQAAQALASFLQQQGVEKVMVPHTLKLILHSSST